MSSNSDSERVVADRYVLRRELGRGGMGVVWQAFDPTLDRDVAIKQVLLPDHFTDAERADAHGRVRREARSAARISHPTVITIHDVFEYDGNPWVVMELVEGGSLQDRLDERGALPPDEVAEIAESLLRAVRAANAAGVLHRDIKPGNIMTSLDGRVILTDFGIATMEGGPSITRTGALIGSPEYMPPERLAGGPAEHRGDLWSIGVTLFAAVEGASPFRRDSITAAIAAVMSAPLPPMTRAGWLEPLISGLLERDPDRRLERLAGRAREMGVRVGTGERVDALPGTPTIVATSLASARALLGDDSLEWESGHALMVDLGLRRGRDPFIVFDADECGFLERYSLVDRTLAPGGEELVQAQLPVRPGESRARVAERLERFLDLSLPGWRERVTWRRDQVARGRTGALDLPGYTWRDRPAVDRGDGVYLAGDAVAAPGLLGEVSLNSAVAAAEAATGGRSVRAV
ncbi:serine/threonine protein kinase [Nocardiopsis dassonvillei]|uniref:serine/threonine-protein kinase n=1 Tax=Nocardiopsis dassonvillei TaxID=2014 RepID=UPI00200D36ED|nr:serine/threonine-protein kinase [Nocardiopsis dassonvillei]MCK9872588.1 serine/threonine protein kinase [Nocardiopsis dassonvillei]